MKTKPLIIGLLCIAAIVVLLSWGRLFPSKHVESTTTQQSLPGLQTGDAPWIPEIAHLKNRLDAVGLPALADEGTVLHIHQHLDLSINGMPVVVPAGIGINEAAGFISPIHAHDTTGIIHVESNTIQNYTLGQVFDIWGVKFTSDCIGGYCTDPTHSLKVYSNGTLVSGDPRNLVLTAHQEIMVVYGTTTPAIIPSYAFPPNY